METLNQKIDTFLKSINIKSSLLQKERMLEQLQLVKKWNSVYNLTAINSLEEMVSKHLFDSLSIAPFLKGQCFLDVGTGAGFPGVPLAILYPESTFYLLDSLGKRITFLRHIQHKLDLKNIVLVRERVERYQPKPIAFDGIITRAFSSMLNIIQKTQHVLAKHGKIYAMKSSGSAQELDEVRKNNIVFNSTIEALFIPGLEGKRELVLISLGK